MQLDLVNRLSVQGPAVGEFARYGQTQDWKAWLGLIEGRRPALIQQHERRDALPDYFVVLVWSAELVPTTR